MLLLPAHTSKGRTPDGIPACVHVVRKRCYLCGHEWDGKAFTAQPIGAKPLPGTCETCLAKDEAIVKGLTTRVREVSAIAMPELATVRRASDGLDD